MDLGTSEVLPTLPDKWEMLLYLMKPEELVTRRQSQLQDYVRRLCQICNKSTVASNKQRNATMNFLERDAYDEGPMLLDTPPLSPTSSIDARYIDGRL